MSTPEQDFTDILLQREIISPEQLAEARDLQKQTGAKLPDTLLKLGYAAPAQVMRARAEQLGLVFLDLTDVIIPQATLELMPESVARENVVLPIAVAKSVLIVALCDPDDRDTLQKLEFILNKDIHPVLALREQIIEAINRHYGQSETESVDSMLAEFTDTAIDFTRMETSLDMADVREDSDEDFELAAPSSPAPVPPPPAASPAAVPRPPMGRYMGGLLAEFKKGVKGIEGPESAARSRSGKPVSRRATVRYYDRMCPERMFPLLVVLSRQAIEEVVQRGVVQTQSKTFKVEEGSLVEVEPILPGCQCYPPREQVRIGKGETTAKFWVVPHVLGALMQARVVIRQDGETLAEVPLQARVARQGITAVMGALSLVLPFVLLLLRHFRLDFESQLQDGFSVYAYLIDLALHALTPEMLTGLLLAGTAALYLWLRPRKRDLFWDITPTGPAERDRPAQDHAVPPAAVEAGRTQDSAVPPSRQAEGGHLPGGFLEEVLESQNALLKRAEEHYQAGEYPAAVRLYEHALKLGRSQAIHYLRASTAAYRAGNVAQALEILLHATTLLPEAEIRGEMWYNMGCCAARLGRFPEAMRFLNRAVDAGYDRPEKYHEDPDLEPLRGHPSFKRFLLSAGY